MSWLRFFRREQRDAESAQDIQFYFDTETEDNIAHGMSGEEARVTARRKFGNPGLVREEIYRMNSAMYLETLWQDTLYALRTMRNNSAFAMTAALTLALGIGGNTAIFTLVRAVLLKPLQYRQPDRLVYLSVDNPRKNTHDGAFTLAQFENMRDAEKSFIGFGVYGPPENVALSGNGEPEALKGARVSANFLDILGVQPLLGRSFLPEEDKHGGRPVAMISTELWRRRFGGDPFVAGQPAVIDSTAYTIIGVLPAKFEFPFAGVDVWVTRPTEWSLLPPRFWGIAILTGFARLKPGVTLAQAQAEISTLHHQYNVAHPSPLTDPNSILRVVLLKDRLIAGIRPMFWTLFGAVGFVLLIACANVASLMLARATSRTREFSLRAALGAGRGRLIQQLLIESLVLAAAGGALGMFLAKWGLSALTRVNALFLPTTVNALYLPGVRDIRLDGWVLAFTVALSLATGVLFGLFPSLQVSRPDLANVLRESGAAAGRSAIRHGIFKHLTSRGVLVAGQMALSIVLLIGAALLMKSFLRLSKVDPGFQPANLLTMKIALPSARYDTDQKRAAFFRDLLPLVQKLPGIKSAAMVMSLPTTTWIRTNFVAVEGKPPLDAGEATSYGVIQSITPEYFSTLGIPLKRGRQFSAHDNTPAAPPVMIVNESLARHLWPDYPGAENPIGRHVKEGTDKSAGWIEVVGIVADIHEGGLAYDPVPEFYVPFSVHPPPRAYLAVRTNGDPLRFANAIRSRVLTIDRDQPVSDIETMDAVFDATMGQRRLTMLLLTSFAAVALLLAVIGIYGVIAYSVAQRTQEVGIRRALGAQHADILRLVLGQGMGLALGGGLIGVCAALGLTRVLKGFLFGVTSTDPATFVGIALLFLVVALAAAYFPARRASRIDPMTALRS